MYLISVVELFGRLHPALVHLPIGILMMGLVLQVLTRSYRFTALRPAIPLVLLCGAISAGLSCITGLLLYSSGDYQGSMVSWHLWMALTLTFVSLALWGRAVSGRASDRTAVWMSLGVFALLMITGHLGGTLTYGQGYFTGAFAGADDAGPGADTASAFRPIADVQQAMAYEDVVRPILQTECYSCHGPHRQKGGLRLDDMSVILKGGRGGAAVSVGHGETSEMIRRMRLPDEDDDHMPPKKHRQPSKQQIALLSWWIDQGAVTGKKVGEVAQPEAVKGALKGLEKPSGGAGGAGGGGRDAVEKVKR